MLSAYFFFYCLSKVERTYNDPFQTLLVGIRWSTGFVAVVCFSEVSIEILTSGHENQFN